MPCRPPQVPPIARLRIRVLRPIERPDRRVAGLFVEAEIPLPVDRHADLLRRPQRLVDVKLIVRARHADVVALVGALHVVVGAGVDVGVDAAGIEADVLHDVDLAARGPSDVADAGAERPDCRPGAAPFRQLRADLDAAVGPARAAGQARRRVSGALVRLLARFDDQHAVLDARIVRALPRVVLLLLVADQSDFLVPPRGIRQPVTIEFVVPDERGAWLRGRGC